MVSQNWHQKNKQERQNRYIKLCQNLELLHFKVYYGKSEDSPPKGRRYFANYLSDEELVSTYIRNSHLKRRNNPT